MGLLQSMSAPVDRFRSGGLFAEYARFYVAVNSACMHERDYFNFIHVDLPIQSITVD